MEKELEALENLISKTGCMNDTCAHLGNCLKDNKCRYNDDNLMCPDHKMAKTLKNALTELKAIKEAKPSEALEKLLDRANHDEYLGRIGTEEAIKFLNENQIFIATIKQTLLKAQEQENVLEIIKELFDIQIIETDSKEMATITISRKDSNSALHFAQKLIKDKEKINLLKRWSEKLV